LRVLMKNVLRINFSRRFDQLWQANFKVVCLCLFFCWFVFWVAATAATAAVASLGTFESLYKQEPLLQ